MEIPLMFPNVARVAEIAIISNTSITIIYDGEYVSALSDYELIKAYYPECKFTTFGLRCEMVKPTPTSRKGESINDIRLRIDKAKEFNCPNYTENDVNNSLLKTATERLNLSLSDIDRIKRISCFIAQLDHSNTVQAQHVAESIHYHLPISDYCILAESGDICFGEFIRIKRCSIPDYDVQNAIEYLKQL